MSKPEIDFSHYEFEFDNDSRRYRMVFDRNVKPPFVYFVDKDRWVVRPPPPDTLGQKVRKFMRRFPRALSAAWGIIKGEND